MERVFSTIPTVLSVTASDETTVEALVLAAWKEVAGKALNRRTRAIRLVDRRLTIAVNDAIWQKNLEDLAPGFIARLSRIAGDRKVTFIEFVVDPVAAAGEIDGNTTEPRGFDLDVSLIESANAIADEKLRENFLETATAYLARQTAR